MGQTGVEPEYAAAGARLKPEMASRRLLVLDFVRRYIERWGQSPSYSEIAAGVGIGRARAHQLVRRLVTSGHLLRTPGPRGLALPDQRDEAVRQLRELGWTVDPGAAEARLPYTLSKLLDAPPLTYPGQDRTEATVGGKTGQQGGKGTRQQDAGTARTGP
jgi:hypothetical protein